MTDSAETMASKFSLHDAASMQSPYPMYREFRSKCPIAHSEQLGGFYFVTEFETAKRLYSSFRDFSSSDGTGLPAQPVKMYPIDLDPPEQTKYRKILNPAFTPEAVALHTPRIEAIVNGFIDNLIEDGHAELEGQLIRPTLSATVLPMLGVPLSDQHMVSEKLDYLVRCRAAEPAGAERVGGEVAMYLMGLAAARRAGEPKDDILQTLLGSTVDGVLLSDDQIFRVLIIILFGGLDTTSAAIGEALLHLARHPEDASRLKTGEADWGAAIEEFVRYTSPIQGLRRTVARDVTVGDTAFKTGDIVMMLNGAANRDPEQFAEPDRCIIDRTGEHLAFGAGAHICLGRNVARLVMEILIKAVLHRMPDFTVSADFAPEYSVGESRGMKDLPVTFTPRARIAAAA